MHTQQMIDVAGGIYLPTHTVFANEKDATEPKKPLDQRFTLTEQAVEYLSNPDLFNIIVSSGYQEEQFGKALAHLCFDNHKMSKTICLRILKLIVFSDYDKVKPYIEVVGTLLTIKDKRQVSLQRKRLEWVLGFSYLKWVQKDDARILVGMELTFHNIKEEVYRMKSMLTYDSDNDNSLMYLLWRY
jgi:hypothetical protein